MAWTLSRKWGFFALFWFLLGFWQLTKIPQTETQILLPDQTGGSEKTNQWTQQPLRPCKECDKLATDLNSMKIFSSTYFQFIKANLGTNHIYVTLTTTPNRIQFIHNVLKNLDDTHVHTIFLTLPKLFRGNRTYSIPTALLKAFPKLTILSTEKDYGPISKILIAVEYVQSVRPKANDIFISIDDDNVYGKSMIPTLAYLSLKYDRVAFGASGLSLEFFGLPVPGYPVPSLTTIQENFTDNFHILEGFAGIAYRANHLDIELAKSISGLDASLTPCHFTDDLVLSAVLSHKGIQLTAIKRGGNVTDQFTYDHGCREDLPYFNDNDALHLLNVDGSKSMSNQNTHVSKYRDCYKFISNKFNIIQNQTTIPTTDEPEKSNWLISFE